MSWWCNFINVWVWKNPHSQPYHNIQCRSFATTILISKIEYIQYKWIEFLDIEILYGQTGGSGILLLSTGQPVACLPACLPAWPTLYTSRTRDQAGGRDEANWGCELIIVIFFKQAQRGCSIILPKPYQGTWFFMSQINQFCFMTETR